MTLTIELPDEPAAALGIQARARGVSYEQYARQLLLQTLAPEWLQRSWDAAKSNGLNELSMAEIDAEIAAAREGRSNRAGPEFSE